MEITYAGGTAFKLTGSRTVHFNPASSGVTGEIKLYGRRQRSTRQIVNGPGEYEIGDVLVATVAIESKEGERLVHAVDLDGVSVVLIDTPVSEPHVRRIMGLGRVDVLLIDTGVVTDPRQLVTALSPRLVIPYGNRAPELCTHLGVLEPQPIAKLSWTAGAKLPKAVLLKAPGRRQRVA